MPFFSEVPGPSHAPPNFVTASEDDKKNDQRDGDIVEVSVEIQVGTINELDAFVFTHRAITWAIVNRVGGDLTAITAQEVCSTISSAKTRRRFLAAASITIYGGGVGTV